LNKLKIDYDLAKEQYLNMTQAKKILGKFTKTDSTMMTSDKMTVSKKALLTILQINLTKIKTPVLDNFGRDLTEEMAEEEN
jgi:ATP-dependent Clp protease ATP-binding subunit ClpC